MFVPRESRIANIAGAVLTGGESIRGGSTSSEPIRDESIRGMGDAAQPEIGGPSAATRMASLLEAIFEDLVLVGGDPPASAPGRRVPDRDGPSCALRGVVGALEATDAERVLILATDLRWISVGLLLALVAWPDADIVAPRVDRHPQPLCALYRRDSVLPVAREQLARGRLALGALLDEVGVEYLEDPDLESWAG